LFLKKNNVFGVLEKETTFCSLKKTEKPHSELFLFHHAITLFSELHNNSLLYLLWHSKLRVKKCTPFLCRNVLLVISLLCGKAWQACAQQTDKNHPRTNSAV